MIGKYLCKIGIHRPLKKHKFIFVDGISHKSVYEAECSCGKIWLVNSTCGFFGHKVRSHETSIKNKFNDLEKLFADCLKTNWDCYNAKPITEKNYKVAKSFLNIIPDKFLRVVDVGVDSYGEITFEWYDIDNSDVFSISISSDNFHYYVGIISGTHMYGRINTFKEVQHYVLDLVGA